MFKSSTDPEQLDRKKAVVIAALLVVWVGLLYSNSLDCAFHFDDWLNIGHNRAIRVESLDYATLKEAAFHTPTGQQRPVAMLSIAINYYLGGYDVTGYHLFNIGVHALSALGLFTAVLLLFRLPRVRELHRGSPLVVASIAAFLWASHPIQVQAVTYIIQRMASMATMFTIWSLAIFLWGLTSKNPRRFVAMVLSLLLLLLAIGSKETAMVAPVVLVISPVFLDRQGFNVAKLFAVGGTAATVAVLTLIISQGFSGTWRMFSTMVLEEPGMLLTVPRGLWYGLSIFALPLNSRLNLDHHIPFSTSIIAPPTTILALLALAVLLAAPFFIGKKRPLLAICLLWFLIPYVLEPLAVKQDPFFEHRFYMPSFGLALALALIIEPLSRRKESQVFWGMLAALLFASSWTTYQRNFAWKTELSLMSDVVSKSPAKIRTYAGLTKALMDAGRTAEASAYFEYMITVEEALPMDRYWKGVAAMNVLRFDHARELFTEFLALEPENCEARGRLAAIYAKQGETGAAIAEYRVFKRYCGHSYKFEEIAGFAEAAIAEAEAEIEDNQRARPKTPKELLLLAAMRMQSGQYHEAVDFLTAVLDIEPDNDVALTNLGFCFYDLGEYEQAAASHQRAISVAPTAANAYFGMGDAQRKLGQEEDAVESYRRYLELAPPTEIFRQKAERRIEQLSQ